MRLGEGGMGFSSHIVQAQRAPEAKLSNKITQFLENGVGEDFWPKIKTCLSTSG